MNNNKNYNKVKIGGTGSPEYMYSRDTTRIHKHMGQDTPKVSVVCVSISCAAIFHKRYHSHFYAFISISCIHR